MCLYYGKHGIGNRGRSQDFALHSVFRARIENKADCFKQYIQCIIRGFKLKDEVIFSFLVYLHMPSLQLEWNGLHVSDQMFVSLSVKVKDT